MGEVDFHFKADVPVFDACIALGRRHDRLVREDTVEGTIAVMDKCGVDKALAYSPHAIAFDSYDGNQYLIEMIQGEPRLVPQFCVNPTVDDLDASAAEMHEFGVRSIRMAPLDHRTPFTNWTAGHWLDWTAAENIPVWIAAEQIEAVEFHDTVAAHPDAPMVLSEVHYMHIPWVLPLMKALPNVSIEISRLVTPNGITQFVDAIGSERLLFGSRFPDSPMAPQLYNLHRSGVSDDVLRAICAGNLERLLGE